MFVIWIESGETDQEDNCMKEKEKDNSLSNELQEDDFDRKLEAMLSDDSSA